MDERSKRPDLSTVGPLCGACLTPQRRTGRTPTTLESITTSDFGSPLLWLLLLCHFYVCLDRVALIDQDSNRRMVNTVTSRTRWTRTTVYLTCSGFIRFSNSEEFHSLFRKREGYYVCQSSQDLILTKLRFNVSSKSKSVVLST